MKRSVCKSEAVAGSSLVPVMAFLFLTTSVLLLAARTEIHEENFIPVFQPNMVAQLSGPRNSRSLTVYGSSTTNTTLVKVQLQFPGAGFELATNATMNGTNWTATFANDSFTTNALTNLTLGVSNSPSSALPALVPHVALGQVWLVCGGRNIAEGQQVHVDSDRIRILDLNQTNSEWQTPTVLPPFLAAIATNLVADLPNESVGIAYYHWQGHAITNFLMPILPPVQVASGQSNSAPLTGGVNGTSIERGSLTKHFSPYGETGPKPGLLAGMIWWAGEYDAEYGPSSLEPTTNDLTQAYADTLTNVFAQVRGHLDPNLKIILVQTQSVERSHTHVSAATLAKIDSSWARVREGQRRAAVEDPSGLTSLVVTGDLARGWPVDPVCMSPVAGRIRDMVNLLESNAMQAQNGIPRLRIAGDHVEVFFGPGITLPQDPGKLPPMEAHIHGGTSIAENWTKAVCSNGPPGVIVVRGDGTPAHIDGVRCGFANSIFLTNNATGGTNNWWTVTDSANVPHVVSPFYWIDPADNDGDTR